MSGHLISNDGKSLCDLVAIEGVSFLQGVTDALKSVLQLLNLVFEVFLALHNPSFGFLNFVFEDLRALFLDLLADDSLLLREVKRVLLAAHLDDFINLLIDLTELLNLSEELIREEAGLPLLLGGLGGFGGASGLGWGCGVSVLLGGFGSFLGHAWDFK